MATNGSCAIFRDKNFLGFQWKQLQFGPKYHLILASRLAIGICYPSRVLGVLDAGGCCDQCYIIKHRFLRCKGSNLSLRLSWTVVLFEDPPKVGWVGPFGDQRLVRL